MTTPKTARKTRAAQNDTSTDVRSFAAAAKQASENPPERRGSRFATVAPATYDAAAHTVELVLSTGADVRRWGYIERLLIDPAAVNLTRVSQGAVKVLDSHNAYDTSKIIGPLVSTRFANGQLLGTMKFAETPFAVEKEGMVERGELTSVSIGYEVSLWRAAEIVTDPSTGSEVTIWRADEWTLLEVSFVSVPADPNAGVRSAVLPNSGNQPADIGGANKETEDMKFRSGAGAPPAGPTVTDPAAAPVTRTDPPAAPATAAAPAAVVATRFTASDALAFIDQARVLGVEDTARSLISQNESGSVGVDACFRQLSQAAAEAQRARTPSVAGGTAARVITDPNEATRGAIVEALVCRALSKAPSEQASGFMGHRLMEIAIMRTPGLNPRERDVVAILRAANTSSDFPLILEAAANKVLMDRYQLAAPTYRAIARKRDLQDFKATKLLSVGDFPTLLKYGESAEIKAGTINEGRESVILSSYGRILRLSRQALINDDLGAFDDVFGSVGRTVAAFENATFYAMKNVGSGLGPQLADNLRVFDATATTGHGNYTSSGTVPSVKALGIGRSAIMKQKNIDGNFINVAPTVIACGPDILTQVEQLVTSVTPEVATSVNPFSGKLTAVGDANYTAYEWELYAPPEVAPVWSFGYLASAPGPRVLTENPFDVDGVAMRVTLDFYAGAVGYKGAYRNAGTAPA